MKLQQLRADMARRGLDGFLVTGAENRYYMSGFTGSSGLLLITHDDALLITDFRYKEQAARQAEGYRVVVYEGQIFDAVGNVVRELGLGRLGFEAERTTYASFEGLSRALDGVAELVPTRGAVEGLRMVKSPEELEIMAEACRITDAAFDHILGFVRPGVTEKEIATELKVFMLKHDMTPSFDFIVASGARGSMPHGVASDKVVEKGDFVTLDFGGFYKRYSSDITRTVVVGKPTDEQRRIYDLVLRAQLAGVAAARAGKRGSEVDAVAREIINQAGHKEHFGHGLGHAIGLEVHENPRFSPTDSTVIQPGMVLSVEPGVYIPGWGGVRIEDLVVITDGDARVMYSSTKELIEL
ncbi:MAG: Xaa-Pro peptidase family protein [Bacillota bacterium]|jgi:Xaa-Pro aminopeptidase